MASQSPTRTLGVAASFVLTRVVTAVALSLLMAAAVILIDSAAVVILVVSLAVGLVRGPRGGMKQRLRAAFETLPSVLNRLARPPLGLLRGAAQRERMTVARFSGTAIRDGYRVADPDRALKMLADPATWKDAAYFLLAALVGVVAVGVIAGGWMLPLGLLALPLLLRFVATVNPNAGVPVIPETVGVGEALLLLGLLAAVTVAAPVLTHAVAGLHVSIAESLLGPGEQARLRAQVGEQRERRLLAVGAAEAERRRIERDLHDGAQQRLVSLALHLGMARERFDTDPAGAQALVAEAHTEAKQALSELRDLARGIHPAVLADRGLDAALSALARRAGVPVQVSVHLDGRPSASAESTAYFVAAEALTNVARHAAATRAAVSATSSNGLLVIEVSDDGVGGADPVAGTGLAGLADRVAAVEGRLVVDSPVGGPTVIRAELPCGS